MIYYFKDKNDGIGISMSKNVIGDIEWIEKEEYEELLAIHKQRMAEAAEEEVETE